MIVYDNLRTRLV